MQYKCDFCQDTGSLHFDSDLLDCSHCDATTGRIALDQWLAVQYKQGGMVRTDSLAAWRIHQRALAMAPKQESPAQEPVAQDCGACLGSGWVPRDADIGTEQECFSCDGSGKIEDAAPAAANGAMPELSKPETMIVESDLGHRAYSADQMRAYGQACALAAAGPNAAPPDEKIMKLCKCKFCKGEGWVCENHADKPWTNDEGGCKCGAGAPCTCNSNVDLPEGFIILSGAKGN